MDLVYNNCVIASNVCFAGSKVLTIATQVTEDEQQQLIQIFEALGIIQRLTVEMNCRNGRLDLCAIDKLMSDLIQTIRMYPLIRRNIGCLPYRREASTQAT